MITEIIELLVKISALALAVCCIGLAVCPKEIPLIGVVWAKNPNWKNRISLALSGILLVVLWF